MKTTTCMLLLVTLNACTFPTIEETIGITADEQAVGCFEVKAVVDGIRVDSEGSSKKIELPADFDYAGSTIDDLLALEEALCPQD